MGPRSYNLQIALQDNGTRVPGPQRVIVSLTITIVNVNDPPLLVSSNTTTVPENSFLSAVVYTFVSFDEDNDTVSYAIIAGNLNTGVYSPTDYARLHVPVTNPSTVRTAFPVDAALGSLTPASVLNYELLNNYDLTVALTDNNASPLTTLVHLKIAILDRNDP